MPHVVSIVGKSESGKTRLIEKLVRELKSRGYRLATVKHTPHGMDFDVPDKDSWRHMQAGSEATVISSPDKLVLIKHVAPETTLEEIARIFGEDYDLILAEGFKQGNAPKIEVHRKGTGPPFSNIKKLIAIASDEPLETKVRQFPFEDVKGLANLLEKGFIEPQRERAALYVNNTSIPLSTFPKEFITNVFLAMVSPLKGVGKVRKLEFFIRREPEQDC